MFEMFKSLFRPTQAFDTRTSLFEPMESRRFLSASGGETSTETEPPTTEPVVTQPVEEEAEEAAITRAEIEAVTAITVGREHPLVETTPEYEAKVKKAVLDALEAIFNTPKGRELFETMKQRAENYTGPGEYRFVVEVKQRVNYTPEIGGDKIVVDYKDSRRPSVNLQHEGGEPFHATASFTRVIAHELGHGLGSARDDGTNQMNNISAWENPIMSALGYANRITYLGDDIGNEGIDEPE